MSQHRMHNPVAEYDFEDTYDGLGDELDENDDEANRDTFGQDASNIGKDFDFFGNTAQISEVLDEEQITFSRRKVMPSYTKTEDNAQEPLLTPMASLWDESFPSKAPSKAHVQQEMFESQQTPSAKKVLSLEEIEAEILGQISPHTGEETLRDSRPMIPQSNQHMTMLPQQHFFGEHGVMDQRHQHLQHQHYSSQLPAHVMPQTLSIHQQRPPSSLVYRPQQMHRMMVQNPTPQTMHQRLPSHPMSEQLMHEHQRQVSLEHERRARHAQKMNYLARYDGIMTKGDKNFVQRIQISQLISDDPYADDFYYQVYTGAHARQNPIQAQNKQIELARCYLHQHGQASRRNRRNDDPLQRMQQQVMKVIEQSKSRPKATQLTLEGALGKIAFGSVRRPRKLLNVQKSTDIGAESQQNGQVPSKQLVRKMLKSIENAYDCLIQLGEIECKRPPPPSKTEGKTSVHLTWEEERNALTEKLWSETHIMEPIDQSPDIHPFVAFISYGKGKKAIPRIFLYLDQDQQATIVTMIVAHLDQIDVVRLGDHHGQWAIAYEEEIDTFLRVVLPALVAYINEAPLRIIIGLLGILLERADVSFISRTKVGLAFLTMFTARAEQLKHSGESDAEDLRQWNEIYERLLGALQGSFLDMFPPQSRHVDDVYVWQFLASMAVGATLEQQAALVTEVRERVLENVLSAKQLPEYAAAQKIANTNLFLGAMGLNCSQLSI